MEYLVQIVRALVFKEKDDRQRVQRRFFLKFTNGRRDGLLARLDTAARQHPPTTPHAGKQNPLGGLDDHGCPEPFLHVRHAHVQPVLAGGSTAASNDPNRSSNPVQNPSVAWMRCEFPWFQCIWRSSSITSSMKTDVYGGRSFGIR